MFEEEKYEYVTQNVTMLKGTVLGNEKFDVPDGQVVAMAAIVAGNTEDRIVDLGVFNNNNEVVKTCDVRFSQKTNGGTFKDSMRPVDFAGGKQYEVRLLALAASPREDITVQVLFMIRKP
jgi:hypothetical protein